MATRSLGVLVELQYDRISAQKGQVVTAARHKQIAVMSVAQVARYERMFEKTIM